MYYNYIYKKCTYKNMSTKIERRKQIKATADIKNKIPTSCRPEKITFYKKSYKKVGP